MKKILILTHGELGKGFISSLQIICGETEEYIDTISMGVNETLEMVVEEVNDYIEKCSDKDTIIILTDIAIGTTNKAAIPFAVSNDNVYLVTGINLPLILSIVLTDLSENTYEKIQSIIEETKSTVVFMNEQIDKIEDK